MQLQAQPTAQTERGAARREVWADGVISYHLLYTGVSLVGELGGAFSCTRYVSWSCSDDLEARDWSCQKEKHPLAIKESALLVAPTRLELVTQGSSGLCSTN